MTPTTGLALVAAAYAVPALALGWVILIAKVAP